jgi:hypothetical protein
MNVPSEKKGGLSEEQLLKRRDQAYSEVTKLRQLKDKLMAAPGDAADPLGGIEIPENMTALVFGGKTPVKPDATSRNELLMQIQKEIDYREQIIANPTYGAGQEDIASQPNAAEGFYSTADALKSGPAGGGLPGVVERLKKPAGAHMTKEEAQQQMFPDMDFTGAANQFGAWTQNTADRFSQNAPLRTTSAPKAEPVTPMQQQLSPRGRAFWDRLKSR